MSTRIVGQASLQDGTSGDEAVDLAARICDASKGVESLARSHAGVNGDGSVGGGDLTFDLLFDDDAACAAYLEHCDERLGVLAPLARELAAQAGAIAGVDAVGLDVLGAHVGVAGLVGLKRTLLLRVKEDTSTARRAGFEHDMLAMAPYVPAIRNWSFARTPTEGPNPGPSRWTHVWEQEFERIEGLLHDYMTSPYHWGRIDPWFDPECPHAVVDPRIAHVFCPATESVLDWTRP